MKLNEQVRPGMESQVRGAAFARCCLESSSNAGNGVARGAGNAGSSVQILLQCNDLINARQEKHTTKQIRFWRRKEETAEI